jgi:hypothetical protein
MQVSQIQMWASIYLHSTYLRWKQLPQVSFFLYSKTHDLLYQYYNYNPPVFLCDHSNKMDLMFFVCSSCIITCKPCESWTFICLWLCTGGSACPKQRILPPSESLRQKPSRLSPVLGGSWLYEETSSSSSRSSLLKNKIPVLVPVFVLKIRSCSG